MVVGVVKMINFDKKHVIHFFKKYNLNKNKKIEVDNKEINHSVRNEIVAKGLFDEFYYLNSNPDVKDAGVDAFIHYINFGWKEGRNPSENFCTEFYLKSNSDVQKAGINPLLHYIEYGINENRLIKEDFEFHYPETSLLKNTPLFSEDYYKINYPDVKGCPFSHYSNYGWKEGRNPSNEFDTNYYLENNLDVKNAGLNPLEHWIQYGQHEGRKTNVIYADNSKKEPCYPSIIFISHEASETGAPAVLLSLMKWIKENTDINFAIVVGAAGPWNHKFEQLAPTFFMDRPHTEKDIKNFCGDHVQSVYINTIASATYAKALDFLEAEVITHVHEMENVFKIFEHQVEILKEICTKYIAVSPGSIDAINARFNKEKIELNYLKPFINKFESQAALFKPNPHKKVIFGCGAVEKRKGFDIFCKVGSILKNRGISNIEMHWIGSDSNKDLNAEQTITKFDIADTVKYLGTQSYPRDYFSYGDIFLLPSREDPYPLVCMEAAELGLPVVCFDEKAGGMYTFVEHDAGLVVPYLDADAMADAIQSLLKDEEKRNKYGVRVKEKVQERHYVDVIAPQILELLPITAKAGGINKIENYKALIKTAKIISFDIFDTLVMREFARPEVVFDIVEQKHTQRESGILPLFDKRMKTAGRVLASKKGRVDDIDINEIYREMPVYRNSEIEKSAEIDICITHPIGKELYDYAIEEGKKIYITSDMYLDRNTIEKILKKNGYAHWDAFFLSSEFGKKKDTGKLFEEVKAEAKRSNFSPEEILHIGDNWTGDVKFARRAGINAVRFSPIYEADEKLINLSEDQISHLPQSGRIWESFTTQATRIWSQENPELSTDFYTKLGFELTGPLASMMAMHTKKLADKKGVRKIIFMARDGRIIKKAFDVLYKDDIKSGKYQSEYLHLSRATVVPATYQNPVSSNDIYFLIEGLHLAEKNIGYFLQKANLDIKDKAIRTKVKSFFKSLDYIPNWNDFSKLATMFESLSDDIHQANASNRAGLQQYLDEKGVFAEDKVLVVDVGWLLNIQSRLVNFFERIGATTQVIGSYVGSRERIDKNIAHSSLLYDMGEPATYSRFLETNVTLFEVLFSSPEPSAASITEKNSHYHLELKSLGFPLSKEYVVAQKLQMGAEDYFKKLASAKKRYFPEQISRDYFFSIFEALVNTDNALAKAELGNFEVKLGGHHEFVSYQELIKNNSFFEYRLKPKEEYFEPILYQVNKPETRYVIVTSAGLDNGSTRYRALNFAESLQFKNIQSVVIHSQTEVSKAKQLITESDIVVFQRCFAEQGNVGQFLSIAKKLNKTCIGEMDDLVFPEHIETIGSVKGGEWNIDEARFVAKSYEQFLLKMDRCIVSTTALKEYIESKYNLNCEVIPNKISYTKIRQPTENKGPLKLIYASGTYSHKEDFELIEKPLYDFLTNNPEVTLSILGATQSSERILALPNVSSYPLLPYDAMLEFISRHDLMLVPLVDDIFNDAKSNVKLIECNASSVYVLASEVREYKRHTSDGINLFRTTIEFRKKLQSYLNEHEHLNSILRKKEFISYIDENLTTLSVNDPHS